MPVRIGLFIPTYNVERTIAKVLASIPPEALKRFDVILIIDNQSSDQTLQAVQDFHQAHPGYPIQLYQNDQNYLLGGSTVMAFELALQFGIDHLICLHSDGQASGQALSEFIRYCDEDCFDFILGSRLLATSQTPEYSKLRHLANLLFAYAQQLIIRERVFDLGAYVSFNMRTIRNLPYRAVVPDMGYHPNLILTASRLRTTPFRFKEFPISWGAVGISNVNVFTYAIIHALRLLRLALCRIDTTRDYAREMRTRLIEQNCNSHQKSK